MPPAHRFFRTTVVRLSLVYIVAFALGATALLIAVYGLTTRLIDSETDNILQAELQGLAEQYSHLGLNGLAQVIRDRSEGPTRTGSVYLLLSPQDVPIVGNLNSWPTKGQEAGRWMQFDTQVRVGDNYESHPVRAALVKLQGGYRLLVGTDIVERVRFQHVMQLVGGGAIAVIVLFGAAIGVWSNRRLLRQVNRVVEAGREIADGDFGHRLPVQGTGDELDTLASNLNQLLDRIEQLTVALKFVIDGTAHDLKGPLNRLRARIERSILQSSDAQRETLEQVLRDAEIVQRTLDSLLRIAQAQSGSYGAETSALSLGNLAREIGELYAPLAEEQGIHLQSGSFPEAPIRGSRQLLAHAIANLLDNAVKYTPAGGRVELAIEELAGKVRLIVADTGPGIPTEDRARVLERFVRLDSARAEPGSGLGLSLVAAVCRLHHAQLALEDNGPGLRVVVEFPRIVS
jgi:signal transduction histidine kinase